MSDRNDRTLSLSRRTFHLTTTALLASWLGCERRRHAAELGTASTLATVPEAASPERIRRWEKVEQLPGALAVFETVFWEPLDTESLRQWMFTQQPLRDRTVLEIGTGSGLLSLCALQAGASWVVATDVNPAAVACAQFNARQLGVSERLDVRLVDREQPSAYAVLRKDERSDYLISNPPWEDGQPQQIDQYALYDPGFALMHSLMVDLPQRLNPGGEALLAYGCKTAILKLEEIARSYGYEFTKLDDRPLDDLPENFLPGMLLSIRPR